MTAHPMITPLTTLSPDAVAATYPADAAALYRLLWDTTLAHLKGPPGWQCTRIVFGDSANPLAMDWDQLETPGWLALRKSSVPMPDAPLLSSNAGDPRDACVLEQCTFSVVPRVEPRIHRGVDDILRWTDDFQIASPNRLATLLDTLIEQGSMSLDDSGQIEVTPKGNAQLARATNAGFGELSGRSIARWRVACDDYCNGAISLESLASQAGHLVGMSMFDVVATLDALVTHGHEAKDAYALRDHEAVRPTDVSGYPSAMDPEVTLSSDHPLRAQREEAEQALTGGREHSWCFLPKDERVAIRMGYLASMLPDDSLTTLADDLRFDVRVRWLIGLSLGGKVPDIEHAKIAFNAWTSRNSMVDGP